jgi:hypothetical protein
VLPKPGLNPRISSWVFVGLKKHAFSQRCGDAANGGRELLNRPYGTLAFFFERTRHSARCARAPCRANYNRPSGAGSVAHTGAMQVVVAGSAAPTALGCVLRIRTQPSRVGLASFAPPGLVRGSYGSDAGCSRRLCRTYRARTRFAHSRTTLTGGAGFFRPSGAGPWLIGERCRLWSPTVPRLRRLGPFCAFAHNPYGWG